MILSDINMPGMDGLTLLREIKQRGPDLPVMMVTAYGDDERRRRAGEYGAAEFITKPVDFDLLKQQLQQLAGAAGVSGPVSDRPKFSRVDDEADFELLIRQRFRRQIRARRIRLPLRPSRRGGACRAGARSPTSS